MNPVMRDLHRIDADMAERLLSGHAPAHDLPEGAASVAALVEEMTRHAQSEPAPALVTAMAATARSSFEPTAEPTRKNPMIAKVLTAKVAAAAAVVAFTATGAAAATGTLPDAAQDGISKAASHVGINLPDSADDRAREATEDRGPDSDVGPGEDNHGTTVSGVATETDATGADKGAEISTTARDGHGEAPVDTPNPGGTTTADDASDGASSTGTDNANDAAGDGSANAADHPTADNHPTGQP